jgi:hypothetical protein
MSLLAPTDTVVLAGKEYTLIERAFTGPGQKPLWYVCETSNPRASIVLKTEEDLLRAAIIQAAKTLTGGNSTS